MFKPLRLSVLLLTVAASGAYAAADGFYYGVSAGWGVAKYSATDFANMASASFQDNNFAFGGNFGYQFSALLATELGYTHMQHIAINDISMGPNTPGGATSLSNSTIAFNIFDLALKGMIPLRHGFGINGKVGAAYVKTAVSGGIDNSALGSAYSNNSKILPELGMGVSYDFNKNTTVGIDVKQIFKGGNIPNIYTAMFNFGYHFG